MFACLFYGFDDGGEYATGNCRVLKSFFADKYGSVRALGVIGKLCGFGLFGKVKKIGSFWGGWSGKSEKFRSFRMSEGSDWGEKFGSLE